MSVRFAPRALNQLAHIREYTVSRRADSAELVRGRILATIERLQQLPRIGHAGPIVGTREVTVPGLPYIIVYRIDVGDEDELMVLGVFHAAQDR